jgi:hypothetical protein
MPKVTITAALAATLFFLLIGGRTSGFHDSCDIESLFPTSAIRIDEKVRVFLVRVVTLPVRKTSNPTHQYLLQHLKIDPLNCKNWRLKMLGGGLWAIAIMLILAALSYVNYLMKGFRRVMSQEASNVNAPHKPKRLKGFVMIDPTYPLLLILILELNAVFS